MDTAAFRQLRRASGKSERPMSIKASQVTQTLKDGSGAALEEPDHGGGGSRRPWQLGRDGNGTCGRFRQRGATLAGQGDARGRVEAVDKSYWAKAEEARRISSAIQGCTAAVEQSERGDCRRRRFITDAGEAHGRPTPA